MEKLTLKDQLSPFWYNYKFQIKQAAQASEVGLKRQAAFHEGMVHAFTVTIEELVLRYYDAHHIDSGNRAHAEMVLEILGVN
jgi:hypothetical protein